MHPAFSVIFLTTLIGVGQGLFLALYMAELGALFDPVAADATDPDLPGRLLREHRPSAVVLVAGALPTMRPLHLLTWEELSRPWQVDVRQAFQWLRASLS